MFVLTLLDLSCGHAGVFVESGGIFHCSLWILSCGVGALQLWPWDSAVMMLELSSHGARAQ